MGVFMARDERSGRSASEQKHSVANRQLHRLVTDDEFKDIARILGVAPDDEEVRQQIGIAIFLPIDPSRRWRPSKKQEKLQLERLQAAAAELCNAIKIMKDSIGPAFLLLALAMDGFDSVGEYTDIEEDLIVTKQTNNEEKNRFAFSDLLFFCDTIDRCAKEVIENFYGDPRVMRGRPPDTARDEVLNYAANIFYHCTGHRPTLTTHAPLDDHTTYGGKFYEFASIVDRAYLRAAGRDPKTESQIGSVLKRLLAKEREPDDE